VNGIKRHRGVQTLRRNNSLTRLFPLILDVTKFSFINELMPKNQNIYKERKKTKTGDMYMEKNPLDLVALILLIIGGLNWGLVGLFDFDLVAAIFGAGSLLAKIIYIIVGLAGLYTIYYLVKK